MIAARKNQMSLSPLKFLMVCASTVLKEFLNSGETKAPPSGYTNFLQDMFFFMSCTRSGKEEKVVKKPSMPSPIQEIKN